MEPETVAQGDEMRKKEAFVSSPEARACCAR